VRGGRFGQPEVEAGLAQGETGDVLAVNAAQVVAIRPGDE
jgi:hypothetical protein